MRIVYIGLYGYDYLTAGRNVMELFRARGWTTLINDDLVTRVLLLLNIVIGILTGCVALMLSNHYTNWLIEFNGTSIGPLLAFIIPFIIGVSISTIIMGVVASAVDTVMVAFCEAPLEFERNHPGLHRQMITSYSLIYPEEFGVAGGFNQQTPL
jgi:Plasma-membrane choline transporter